MGLDCRAKMVVGIPIKRSDFYTFQDTGIYTCSFGHDSKEKFKYCPECGRPLGPIRERIFTAEFLEYCKYVQKDPNSVIDEWLDEWEDRVLRIHPADEIIWSGAEAEYEVLGIRILETESHRSHDGDRKCLDQKTIDLAFQEVKTLGQFFYGNFDIDLYLSLEVSS